MIPGVALVHHSLLPMFSLIALASLFVASLSLTGIIFLGKEISPRVHRIVLPFAVGIFLGVVFFDLIPETLTATSGMLGPLAIMCGFLAFYALAHVLETYHHHHGSEEDSCEKSGARLILIGDAVHNFADGIVLASAFMVNPTIGIFTTLGIALHEIPQEIAEFGILRRTYSHREALTLNFLSATTILVGSSITYFFAIALGNFIFILTGIAAGNLLYIASADLIPELKKSHREHFFQTFCVTVTGVALIALLVSVMRS